MKQAILLLISGAFWVSTGAFASQNPAAGKSVLKLDDSKTLAVINKELAQVDQDIINARNLAAAYKALPNNGLRSSQADAQTVALQIQRDELLRQRAALVESVE